MTFSASRNSSHPERIYLDNAATTWPKPEAVYRVVERWQRENGAPAGRGAYTEAMEVLAGIARARLALARLLGVSSAERILFSANGTDALNLAIMGLREYLHGGHVISSCVEHNSVLRPLRALEAEGTIQLSLAGCSPQGVVNSEEISTLFQKQTRLVVLTHASNVTGALQPVEEVGRLAREHGAFFLVDAAQTMGEVVVNAEKIGADLLAAPGHKGLLGPLGTGFLYLRSGLEKYVKPQRYGGTGSHSEMDRQPENLPDRYEAGNLNVPGILGLGAGIEFLEQQGIESLRARTVELTRQLLQELQGIPRVKIWGPAEAEQRIGMVSITLDGFDSQELAGLLDSHYRIQTRGGLHCAARIHQTIGTVELGGTIRFSLGPFNTSEQIKIVGRAMREISAMAL